MKGRQARSGGGGGGRSFQTWADQQDVEDLMQWQEVFGEGFTAILNFVYWIDPPLAPEPGMFEHKERWYLMMGVQLAEYRRYMRRRSEKWATVSLRAADFRSLARPIESWL